MAAIANNLTLAEFEIRYNRNTDLSCEFWYGESIPKAMPTWIHGFLQSVICKLLFEAGYFPGSEVELRIVDEAHPKPDIIATRRPITDKYPTSPVDIVIEIVSEDDAFDYLKEKFRKYSEWGFPAIYAVDPSDRTIGIWRDNHLSPTSDLAGIAAAAIWAELDRAMPLLPFPPA